MVAMAPMYGSDFAIIAAVRMDARTQIRHKEPPTKANFLCITALNGTKTMVLHTRNLVKAQRYFLQHK